MCNTSILAWFHSWPPPPSASCPDEGVLYPKHTCHSWNGTGYKIFERQHRLKRRGLGVMMHGGHREQPSRSKLCFEPTDTSDPDEPKPTDMVWCFNYKAPRSRWIQDFLSEQYKKYYASTSSSPWWRVISDSKLLMSHCSSAFWPKAFIQ